MTKRMSELAEEIACRPEISQDAAYELLDACKGLVELCYRLSDAIPDGENPIPEQDEGKAMFLARRAIITAERGD